MTNARIYVVQQTRGGCLSFAATGVQLSVSRRAKACFYQKLSLVYRVSGLNRTEDRQIQGRIVLFRAVNI